VGVILTLAAGVVLAPAMTSPVAAAVGDATYFSAAPATPGQDMVSGPDGRLWFADGNGIAAMVPTTRAVTRYPNAGFNGVGGLTVGGDGNIWATSINNHLIARFNISTQVFSFFASGVIFPIQITTAADGNLWYATGSGSAQRMLTTGQLGANTGYIGSTLDIDLGPDGNIWIATSESPARLFRIDPTSGASTNVFGRITNRQPTSTTIGPDGHLWFTYEGGLTDGVGRLVLATSSWTYFPRTGIEYPTDIVAGRDRSLWFTSSSERRFGRATTGGTVTLFPPISPPGAGSRSPYALTAASDGNVWFIESATVARLARITVGAPRCNGRAITVDLAASQTATNGPDVILGTGAAETINALGGNDVVCSGGGVDTVNGGAGNDTVFGQEAGDTLNGQAGADTLDGGAGNDRLNGGIGTDRCTGGAGTDSQTGCERRTTIP
jgi:virginiamycin B lyase